MYQLRPLLCSSSGASAMLQWVARLAARSLCEYCIVDLVEDKSVRRIEIAHADASLLDRLRVIADAFVPARGGRIEQMIVTGEPELVTKKVRPQDAFDFWDELSVLSYLSVPIKVAGETVAIMTWASSRSPRPFDTDDLAFATEVAAWCALALQSSRASFWAAEASTEVTRRHVSDVPPSVSRRSRALNQAG